MISFDINATSQGKKVTNKEGIVVAFHQALIKARVWPEECLDLVRLAVEEIAEEAYILMHERVRTMPNETKEDGRIKTGDMINALDIRAVGYRNGFYVKVGWLGGTPFYTKFQELGTKHGITGMNAVNEAYEHAYSEMQNIKSRM